MELSELTRFVCRQAAQMGCLLIHADTPWFRVHKYYYLISYEF